MFKRFAVILVSSFIIAALAGCQSYNIRDEAKTAAQQTVNIVDDYLARSISAETAYKNIDQINTKWDNETTDESILADNILIIGSSLLNQSIDNSGNRDDIKKKRDEIAKYIKYAKSSKS